MSDTFADWPKNAKFCTHEQLAIRKTLEHIDPVYVPFPSIITKFSPRKTKYSKPKSQKNVPANKAPFTLGP